MERALGMHTSFTVRLDGTDYSVEVDGNTFVVNGRPFVVGFSKNAGVTVDGIAYDVTLESDRAIVDGIVHQIGVTGLESHAGNSTAPRPAKAAAARPAAAESGIGAIRAIMPGTIVRVMVAEGNTVVAGDVLLVLEAMKMENELRAPTSGTVRAVHARPGQAVEMNAVLAEIEPLG